MYCIKKCLGCCRIASMVCNLIDIRRDIDAILQDILFCSLFRIPGKQKPVVSIL